MKHPVATLGLLALVALVVPLPTATPVSAQGASFEYTETSTLEASGLLGALIGRAGGTEERRGVHVLDTKLRSDDGSTSTIMDAAAGEWIILNHDTQTYMKFTLEDFQQMLDLTAEQMAEVEQSLAEMEADMEEARAEYEAAMAEARAAMTVSVDVINTGERRQIHGYDADRHQIIVKVEEAEGIEGAQDVEGGALVIVLDVWNSQELARQNPLYAGHGEGGANVFAEAMMENPTFREMAEDWERRFEGGDMSGSAHVFAMIDPRVGAAMEESMERLSEIDGMAVKTTTVVAVLPPTVELDTELLLAWEPSSMGDQLRGAASEAAQEAARDAARETAREAVRGLTRGLMGRRGGGDQEEEEAEVPEEDLVIQPLIRVTTEVLDVLATGTPTPDMFEIPEGYQQIQMPMFGVPTESPGQGASTR